MCHGVCFEAGRFTQTQSSWTAPCCSRKWMSGPANAWAEFVTDRKKQIGAQLVEAASAIQDALLSAGEVLFSLDKSLSWMSPVFPVNAGQPGELLHLGQHLGLEFNEVVLIPPPSVLLAIDNVTVDDAAVPEPGSLSLLVCGALGSLAIVGLRRRSGISRRNISPYQDRLV